MSQIRQQPSGLNRGINLLINAEWTPQQALAIFELLDDLRDCIWNHYATEIQELIQQQRAMVDHNDSQAPI